MDAMGLTWHYAILLPSSNMDLQTHCCLSHFESALQQDNRDQAESSRMIDRGSFFAFETFSIILDQVGNEDVYPAVHVYLAFVWSVARNGTMKHIDGFVPWKKVATFLNEMDHSNIDFNLVECDKFPEGSVFVLYINTVMRKYVRSSQPTPPGKQNPRLKDLV